MEDQPVFVPLQGGGQPGMVSLSRLDESRKLLELGGADGGLHVGDLQIEADVAVDILVVVTEREGPELLGESLAAGVVLASRAVAIAAPVADTAGNPSQVFIAGDDGTPFAHGDVMGGVKTETRPDRRTWR